MAAKVGTTGNPFLIDFNKDFTNFRGISQRSTRSLFRIQTESIESERGVFTFDLIKVIFLTQDKDRYQRKSSKCAITCYSD